MITKLALLLLAAVLLAGIVSRWRKPPPSRGNAIESARKCSDCGAYLIGPGPCACAEKPRS
jgi:hypothetical protein